MTKRELHKLTPEQKAEFENKIKKYPRLNATFKFAKEIYADEVLQDLPSYTLFEIHDTNYDNEELLKGLGLENIFNSVNKLHYTPKEEKALNVKSNYIKRASSQKILVDVDRILMCSNPYDLILDLFKSDLLAGEREFIDYFKTMVHHPTKIFALDLEVDNETTQEFFDYIENKNVDKLYDLIKKREVLAKSARELWDKSEDENCKAGLLFDYFSELFPVLSDDEKSEIMEKHTELNENEANFEELAREKRKELQTVNLEISDIIGLHLLNSFCNSVKNKTKTEFKDAYIREFYPVEYSEWMKLNKEWV